MFKGIWNAISNAFLKSGKNKSDEIEVDFDDDPSVPRNRDRESSWQRSTLQFDNGYRIDAIILDYSEDGVKVRFLSHERLPDTVTLKSASLGINRKVRTVWQNRGDAGLVFI